MSGRETILARVRAAIRDVAEDEPAHWDVVGATDPAADYRRATPMALEHRVELFAQRVGDYRAHVTRCGTGDVPGAIEQACARHHVRSLVVPDGVPAGWLPDGVEVVADDPPLSPNTLDRCDGVLTACAAAIAATGTIVLDAGPGQGRRALTLVPDLHVCVVDAQRIVAGVPEGVAAMHAGVEAGRAITLISGPSATSDIELARVEGVHGPRRLEVIVAGPG